MVLTIGIGGIFFYFNRTNRVKGTSTTVTQNTDTEIRPAQVTIDTGDGNNVNGEYLPDGQMTAYSILERLSQDKNIPLETQQYDFGIFVQSLDGKESSVEKYWIYYVNGESGQQAADKVVLKDGDKIEWKYEVATGQ